MRTRGVGSGIWDLGSGIWDLGTGCDDERGWIRFGEEKKKRKSLAGVSFYNYWLVYFSLRILTDAAPWDQISIPCRALSLSRVSYSLRK